MAGVYRRLNPRRAQLRRTWAGTKIAVAIGNTYTKSGYGIASGGNPSIPAFGTTPLLDDFNRADGAIGPNWTISWQQAYQALVISSNAATPPFGFGASTWVASMGPDCEAYATIKIRGTNNFIVYARANDLGLTTNYGYYLFVNTANQWLLYRSDSRAVQTALGTPVTQAIAAGDSVGIRTVGSTISAYYKPSGGSWTQIRSETDATFQVVGQVGLEVDSGGGTAFDDFSGGNVVRTGTALLGPKQVIHNKSGYGIGTAGIKGGAFGSTALLDNFNRANSSTLGSNWTADPFGFGLTSLQINSNTAVPASDTYGANWWSASSFGADQEVYCTMPTMASNNLRILLRLINAGTSSASGYALIPGTLDTGIYRIDNQSLILLTNTGVTFANGDRAGLSVVGSTLTAYKNTGSGWTAIGTFTDTTYPSGGFLGLYSQANTALVVDDFGGGTSIPFGGIALLGPKQVTHNRSGNATVGGVGSGVKVYVPAAGGNVYTKSGFATVGGVGAGMPLATGIRYRQSAGAAIPISQPVIATYPFDVIAGSLLVAAVYSRDLTVPSITDSQSNTWHVAGSWSGETVGALSRRGYILYAYNAAAGPTTVTASSTGGGNLDLAIHEFTGFGAIDPLDDAHYQFDSTDPITTDTITTTRAPGELVFAFAVTSTALLSGNTSGDGFTVAVDVANFDSNQTRYQIVSSLGTYGPASFAMSASGESWAGIAAFSAVANVYTKSGFGVAGGLIGSGASASIEVDSGFSTVGGVGSGPKQVTHQKSGFGVAGGLIGSGPSASIEVDTGFSTVHGLGSGSKQTTHTKSGFAIAGGIGSGPKQVDHNRSGYGTVHGLGSGVEVYVSGAGAVYTKSGYAISGGLIGSGSRAIEHDRSGFGIAGGNSHGTKEHDSFKTGFGRLDNLIGSGSKQTTHTKSGFGIAGGNSHGTKEHDYTKTGYGDLNNLIGSGPKAIEHDRSGYGVAGGLIGSGPKQTTHTKSGYAISGGLIGSGPKQITHTKSGYGIAGSIGSGFDTAAFARSGSGIVGLIGSGPSSHSASANKTGIGSAGLIGSGSRAVTTQRTGNGIIGLVGSGSKEHDTFKTGFATVGGIGSGSKQTTHTKSGYAIAGSIGSGARQQDHNRSGYSTVGGVGAGGSASIFVKSGYATVRGFGAGATFRQGLITKTGIGFIGEVGSGVHEVDHFRSGYGIAGGLIGSGSRSVTHTKSGFATVASAARLDTFTRPDESPLAGDWINNLQNPGSGNLYLTSGQVVRTPEGGFGAAWWNRSLGPNQYIEATVNTKATLDRMELFARIANPSTSSFTGYMLKLDDQSGADLWRLWRIDNNSETYISGTDQFQEVTPGDKIKLVCSGSNIESWYLPSGGSWTLIQRVVDSTYSNGGFVGIGISTNGAFDNVGAGPVGLGIRAIEHDRSGYGTVGGIGSGSKQVAHAKSGFGIVGLIGAGASSRAGQANKTGYATVGGIGSGSKQTTHVKSGYSTIGGIGSGSDTASFSRAGHAVVGTIGSGSSSHSAYSNELGSGIVGLIGSGSRALTHVKSGFGVAGTIGSGSKQAQATHTGSGIVGLIGSGASASIFVESGYATVGGIGSGSTARTRISIKSGFATVGDVGSGARITDHPRSGFATVHSASSGSKHIDHNRSGFAVIDINGYGSRAKQTFYFKSGFATIDGNGYGAKQVQYTKSGYGEVGTTASASVIRRTPFSIIVVGVHAYRHWTFNVIVEDTYMISAHKHVTLARSGKHFFIARAFKHNTEVVPRELVYR